MSELKTLQQQLDRVDDTLALLIEVAENIPKLKGDINDIVTKIQGGFDRDELATQMRSVLSRVVNQSDYTKIQTSMDDTAQKLLNAVETSSQQVDRWRSDYQKRSRWLVALISLGIGLITGIGASYYFAFKSLKEYQQHDLQKYQDVINSTDAYARYINSNCSRKQSFSNFITGDTKEFDCSKAWMSASSLIKQDN